MPAPYDFYDYLSYWEGRSYEDNSERIALERFLKKIDRKEKIVDVGGGFGRLCSLYASLYKKCVVLDPSEKNLDTGRKIFLKLTNVKFQNGALPVLPFEKEQFETALMVRVSHHFDDLTTSFAEIFRILTEGGYFILEFANKNHILAVIKAFTKCNFTYLTDLSPLEKRSPQSILENKILFVNHHPKKITTDLQNSGFKIIEILSVSNFRNQTLKRIIPLTLLLRFEKFFQRPLATIYFGPSIFILAKKA